MTQQNPSKNSKDKKAFPLDLKETQSLKEYLQASSPKLLLLTHANPDGDAIGSILGMGAGLKKLGLSVRLACE